MAEHPRAARGRTAAVSPTRRQAFAPRWWRRRRGAARGPAARLLPRLARRARSWPRRAGTGMRPAPLETRPSAAAPARSGRGRASLPPAICRRRARGDRRAYRRGGRHGAGRALCLPGRLLRAGARVRRWRPRCASSPRSSLDEALALAVAPALCSDLDRIEADRSLKAPSTSTTSSMAERPAPRWPIVAAVSAHATACASAGARERRTLTVVLYVLAGRRRVRGGARRLGPRPPFRLAQAGRRPVSGYVALLTVGAGETGRQPVSYLVVENPAARQAVRLRRAAHRCCSPARSGEYVMAGDRDGQRGVLGRRRSAHRRRRHRLRGADSTTPVS